jgi:hypothetical protein
MRTGAISLGVKSVKTHTVSDAAWSTCQDDPQGMIVRVGATYNERKLALFACGVWRSLWHRLPEWMHTEVAQTEIEVDMADPDKDWRWKEHLELIEATQMEDLWGRDCCAVSVPWNVEGAEITAALLPGLEVLNFWDAIRFEIEDEIEAELRSCGGAPFAAWVQQRQRMCELAREIFGFPDVPPIDVSTWVPAEAERVREIAAAIYADSRFEEMPRLADALEAARCRDERVLEHCREDRVHRRGCWVVDWLLQKSQPVFWIPVRP